MPNARPLLSALLALALLAAPLANAQTSERRTGERLAPPAAKASAGYREIGWEDLLPKGWDPMAPFKGLDLARLNDRDPRAIEAMEKLQAAWAEAPVESSLRGSKIRIPGFIIPLDRQGDLVSELLLVPYFGACIHTPPPPANQIIHAKSARPLSGITTMQPIWAYGTLNVQRGESQWGVSGYRLTVDKIMPYEMPKQEPGKR